MRNFLILISIAFLFSCDCDSEEPKPITCKTNPSIDDTPWLTTLKNSITNCSCKTSILKGTYKASQTVYFILINDPLCNGGGTVNLFNCSGDIIAIIELSEFTEQVEIDTTLFSCKD